MRSRLAAAILAAALTTGCSAVTSSAGPAETAPAMLAAESPTPTPTATATPTATHTPTKAKTPRPRIRTPKPRPTPTKTRKRVVQPSVEQGVHPGAFCSDEGSLGRTVKGTLMRCSDKAGDIRARWRRA